jgi:aminoglycoside phosphotransferase (APT) family kinase protein
MEFDSVRQLLERHLDVRTVRPLGTGYDHVAYEVNGELVVRRARISDPENLRHEADILQAVRAATSVPVPEPVIVEPGVGLMVYGKLPGAPLAGLPQPGRVPAATVAALVGLMRDIAAIETDVVDDAPPAEWLDEARAQYADIRHAIPPAHTSAVERFLAAAPPAPPDQLVFCHNDLGAEHVLVDPETRTLTGIIDWSDAARTDPAHDRGRLYRDLGRHLGQPDEQTLFFARCTVLEDLHYGLGEGRETYRNNALAALAHLFTA